MKKTIFSDFKEKLVAYEPPGSEKEFSISILFL